MHRLHRFSLSSRAVPFIALIASIPSFALAKDILGRDATRPYDITGSDVARKVRIDYADIERAKHARARQRFYAATEHEVRWNYLYIEDRERELSAPFRTQQDIQSTVQFALRETYRKLPDEFDFVYIFTSFPTNLYAFFYQPEANDTRGIAVPFGDSNGDSPRQGLVFMNYWRIFEEMYGRAGRDVAEGQARSVFNQEAGHRWASLVKAGAESGGWGDDLLLGRDNSHWSYFLHTNGSPMEGNAWRDNGNGTFTTVTTIDNWRYSDVDLYLMGLLAPSSVAPFFAIANPEVGRERDLTGEIVGRASTPQIANSVTVRGTRHNFSIDDIITRNGERNPETDTSQKSFRVVFVMLATEGHFLSEGERQSFEDDVAMYVSGFEQGTRNLATMNATLLERVRFGGACVKDHECDPSDADRCLDVQDQTMPFCSRACATNEECPANFCCNTTPTTLPADVCLPEGKCELPPPEPCACDATTVCDKDEQGERCTCDPECTAPEPERCACDATHGCDRDADNEPCTCDPECTDDEGDGERDGSTSGCSAISLGDEDGQSSLAWAILAIGLGVARRRRLAERTRRS